ncbi:hypothetical protein HK098_005025 [Nowakowskiella sp. JEL0407]|nr:hypothetical protein HK098_005025 [Nowakowskiella sp. JEL0407]
MGKKKTPKTVDEAAKSSDTANAPEKILLENILALGGSKEDYELLGDVLSDNEVPETEKSGKPKSKKKKNSSDEISESDIQKYLTSLGLNPSKSKIPVVDDSQIDLEVDQDENDDNESYESEIDAEEDEGENEVTEKKPVQSNPQEASESKKSFLKSNLLIDPQQKWYSIALDEIPPSETQIPETKIAEVFEKAKRLLDEETTRYDKAKSSKSSSDREFVSTILKSGTVTDKVSAVTLLIQESPLHTFKLLENNLFNNMATKKARREAVLAIDSIKDIMVDHALPDRKLMYFRDRPLNSLKVTTQHLILWVFEDLLKKMYFNLLRLMEELSKDTLPFVRNKIMGNTFELLSGKPEQEQNLLALLVNKLGDTDRKIASRCVYLLSQLLTKHPNMKLVVISEVEQLLFRQNLQERAQYYAITFLNQIVLSSKDSNVANKLIQIYFDMFQGLVGKKKDEKVEEKKVEKDRHRDRRKGGNNKKKPQAKDTKRSKESTEGVGDITAVDGVDAKMMGAVLTGVNRAFPFSKLEDEIFDKHVNTLFTVVHIGNFNTSVQALSLIFQVQSSRQSLSDRYYRTLYETLLDSRLYYSSKQAMYLNLIFRSLKSDTSMNRTRAFIKRCVQSCVYTGGTAQVPLVCGMLFLVSEVLKEKGLWGMVILPEEEDEEEVFEDKDEEGNAVNVSEGNEKDKRKEAAKYDGRKRDPLYANANLTCLWELVRKRKVTF